MFQKRRAVDKEYIRNRRKVERQRLVTKTEAETLQLLFLFVAEADGKLSDAEAAEYSSFIGECSTFAVVEAGQVDSNVSSSTSGDVVGQLRRYMSVCRPTLTSRRKLLRALRRLAACDGVINEGEILALDEVATILQLTATRETTRERNNRFSTRRSGAAEHVGESASGTRHKTSRATDDTPGGAPWCYAVLGCSQFDSDDVVKKAYRRLASLLHPDKYSARGASPEQIRVHQQEFQRLQEAYEEVKRLRSIGRQRQGFR